MLRNFPRNFCTFVLWVIKNPHKFPLNFPNFPSKNQKMNHWQASAAAQGERFVFFRDFYFWAAGFFCGFYCRSFPLHFCGKKGPAKKNPPKLFFKTSPTTKICRGARPRMMRRATLEWNILNGKPTWEGGASTPWQWGSLCLTTVLRSRLPCTDPVSGLRPEIGFCTVRRCHAVGFRGRKSSEKGS